MIENQHEHADALGALADPQPASAPKLTFPGRAKSRRRSADEEDGPEDGAASPEPAAPPEREPQPVTAQRWPEAPDDPAAQESVEVRLPDKESRKLLVGSVVAVVAAIAGVLGYFQWHKAPQPQASAKTTTTPRPDQRPQLGADTMLPDSPAVVDGPIGATLSSDCDGDNPDPAVSAPNANGADPRRAWVCRRLGGDGDSILAEFGRSMIVDGARLWPGFNGTGQDGSDQWGKNHVVVRCQLTFYLNHTVVGKPMDCTPQPGGKRQLDQMSIDHVEADAVRLTILESGPPLAEPAPTDEPPADGDNLGLPTPALAPRPDTATTVPDATSGTVAISEFTLIGHPV